jgi:ketosteroid isomerase-like protein
MTSQSSHETDLEEFITRCHDALTQQSQGHPEPFLALWSQADDVSIMAAIGGYERGFKSVSALLTSASKTQHFDSWSAENIVTTAGDELGLSVELEHYARQGDGREEKLTLRATQVYRRENGVWKVIHRHGDVLTPVEVKW